jgi:hypothetical protein
MLGYIIVLIMGCLVFSMSLGMILAKVFWTPPIKGAK